MSFNPQFARIGEILVHLKAADEGQIREALSKQNSFGLKIGETLIKLGYIQERDLLKALQLQLEIDVVDENDLVDIDSEVVRLIPEPFAEENKLLAMSRNGDMLTVAMTDPENIIVIDNLKKITNCNINPLLIGEQTWNDAFERHYRSIRAESQVNDAVGNFDFVAMDDEENEISIGGGQDADAPVVKMVNLIISEAVKSNCTDIHIEPLMKQTRVRYRIDGALREAMTAPIGMHNGIVSLIKVMSKLNIAERRLPQDGQISIKSANKSMDVRVSITPTVTGEKVVMRLLDKGDFGFNLTTLGFEKEDLDIFKRWIHRPYGIIIVSGPTGSGKSTTLHSALKEILDIENNIITCEDPVEYRLEGVTQIQVSSKIGLTFGAALRSVLRQDPDIVLIGEIRDEETADIAVKFSLTGHLVFSTLHANDAPSTVTRLIDIGIPAYLVGSSLNLVMAQRLVRKICGNCKTDYTPTPEELEDAGIDPVEAKDINFKIGTGCVHCNNTGYKGRTAIFEMLEVTTSIRKLIFEGKNQDIIREQALRNGMKTLNDSAKLKMVRGQTTIKEVIKFTVSEKE